MASVEDFSELIAARLQSDASRLGAAWRASANGCARHFIVDDLLPDDLAQDVAQSFPTDGAFWRTLKSFRESKKTFAKLDTLNTVVADITDAFHQPGVLDAIEDITGLERLEADPSLYAGGISLMRQGDFLNPHIDNSHDAEKRRYRRLNLLYYIAPDWVKENGGNLELWDEAVTSPIEITSRYNRLVVMETTRTSWHSVNPVAVDAARCCVSNYYFSRTSPDGVDYHHVTSFMGRPHEHWRRIAGRFDNALRQIIASTLGVTRGKNLRRNV
ncbi:MAG: 2OG-Fe(II) oxygenase [Pseudomonadota bacterium]